MIQVEHGQRVHVLRGARTFVLCNHGSWVDRVLMLRRFIPVRRKSVGIEPQTPHST